MIQKHVVAAPRCEVMIAVMDKHQKKSYSKFFIFLYIFNFVNFIISFF